MAKVLVIEDSHDTRELIRVKLAKAGHEVITAEDGETGLAAAFSQKPQLVVLDLILPGKDGCAVARALRATAATSQAAILIVSAKSEIADKLAGFEAGADDYLVKPFDPGELELRARTLLQRVAKIRPGSDSARAGRLVSVFSLRGGVGKTSLAVNLAVTLAQLCNRSTPLFDLSLQNGHVPIFLGLVPKASLDDLVDHWKECRDGDALSDYYTRRDDLVRVLAAPREPASADRVSAEMLRHLLKLAREDSSFVVADLSSRLDEQMLGVLDISDTILILLAPEVASVQTTVETLETFRLLDYPKEKIRIVVNQLFARRTLASSQIETALGLPIALRVPHDPDFFVQAINSGKPYVLLSPNSAGTRALRDFALKLRQDNVDPRPERAPLPKAALTLNSSP